MPGACRRLAPGLLLLSPGSLEASGLTACAVDGARPTAPAPGPGPWDGLGCRNGERGLGRWVPEDAGVGEGTPGGGAVRVQALEAEAAERAVAGGAAVPRRSSPSRWLSSPEPGIGEPAASPSTIAAR